MNNTAKPVSLFVPFVTLNDESPDADDTFACDHCGYSDTTTNATQNGGGRTPTLNQYSTDDDIVEYDGDVCSNCMEHCQEELYETTLPNDDQHPDYR